MSTLQISWSRPEGYIADSFVVYSRLKDGGGDWERVESGSTMGDSMKVTDIYGDRMVEFAIVPVTRGVEAPPQDWTIVEYVPDSTADLTVPATVTGLAAAQAGSLVLLQWDAVTHPFLDHYEIRYGADWENGIVVKSVAAPDKSAAIGWWASGSATFLVRAYTKQGVKSAAAASVTLTIQDEEYFPQQAETDEHAGGYADTKDGTEVSGGNLRIESAPATASAWTDIADTYTWPPMFMHVGEGTYTTDPVDVGAVVDEKIEVALTPGVDDLAPVADMWTGVIRPVIDADDNDLIHGTPGVCDEATGDGTKVNGAEVTIDIDTSPTAGATPTWDGFRAWVPGGVYRYRHVRLRVTLASAWPFHQMQLTALTWRRRRQNRKDEGTVTLSATGGTAVTFATAFTGAPKVTAQYVGASGIFATVESVTASGCSVRLFTHEGTELDSGTVHWHALGV